MAGSSPCVVDTSAWIEWLTGSALGRRLGDLFPQPARWIVPTLVQLELCEWLGRETSDGEADRSIAFTQTCIVVALDTRIALLAADLHRRHGLATADAIVYATAIDRGATPLTCDARFRGLPDVALRAKGRAR